MAGSSSRNGARVIWVVVHTAEGIRKASDLRAFFDRSTDSSAHAVADDTTLLDNLVPYDRAAWTLRNGNARSDNLELCGFAAWTRDEWTRNHQGMLNHAAAWIRSRCLACGIPIRKLDAAGVRRGEAGVIGHVDYTNGTGDGTHWDPGPGFPWDIVIARAAGAGPTTAPPSEAHDMAPQSLPYRADFDNCAFPVEAGSNSNVVKDGWVTLLSTFGSSDYELIAIDGGRPGTPFDGPVRYDNGVEAPSKGTLGENSRLYAKLKDGVDGVAIRYKNNSPGARLGVAFPHVAK